MSEIVTVRHVNNPSLTRKMRLEHALRQNNKWVIVDEFEVPEFVQPETSPVTSKIIVAVIVYNRFDNVKEWIRCWKQSITDNCELVIIHNYRNLTDMRSYRELCVSNGIKYVPRENIGFDIGAFQDVCNYRLQHFPTDFEYLLWCTDDLLPQRKTFLQEYFAAFKPDVASVCYEISKEVNPHIRTTGFMLKRGDLTKVKFNVDPITTKSQCYDFEHRDKTNSFVDQVRAKLGNPVQVCHVEHAPMWDTGHNSREAKMRRSRREKEHTENFK